MTGMLMSRTTTSGMPCLPMWSSASRPFFVNDAWYARQLREDLPVVHLKDVRVFDDEDLGHARLLPLLHRTLLSSCLEAPSLTTRMTSVTSTVKILTIAYD